MNTTNTATDRELVELSRRLGTMSIQVMFTPRHCVTAVAQRVDHLGRLLDAVTADGDDAA
jgi:hypothetical protein